MVPWEVPDMFSNDIWVTTFKRLGDYLGDDRRIVLRCLVISLIATFALYTVPHICGRILTDFINDFATGNYDVNYTINACTMVAAIVVMWYVASSESKRRMARISLVTARRVREDMDTKMMKVSMDYVNRTHSGDIISRFTNDLPMVAQLISTDYVGFFIHAVMIISIVFMMWFTSPQLALIYTLLMPLTILIAARLTRDAERHFEEQKKKTSEFTSMMSDLVSVHRTIKIEGLEDDTIEDFGRVNREFTEAYISSQKRSEMISPIANIASYAGYMIAVVFGVILIIDESLTIGMFMAFMIYVRVLSTPLNMATSSYDKLRNEIISLNRVFELLDAPEDDRQGSEEADLEGAVEFDNISYTYEDGTEALDSVSFKAETGKITALVGSTGSGKTTAAHLLMGLYRPNTGRILVGGKDLSVMSYRSISRGMACVLQNPWVFDGTLKENIIYNRDWITDERMREISAITGLDSYVSKLPDGYDSMIGEDMKRVPLAQRRMISITRAIIGDPKVLILDEAVAGLDPITAQRIFDMLRSICRDRTIILITHNPVMIEQADAVVRLEKGRVAA